MDDMAESSDELTNLEHAALSKTKEYIEAELNSIGDDYKLLQLMNNLAKEKYTEMSVAIQRLIQQSANLNSQYETFKVYQEQANEIEARVAYLEQVTDELERLCVKLKSKP
ncbi:hypothetical protein MP638_004661 [Amoeboaphelidium occidentale]|nr:hypothetical protein MP638_004661 [Amoeboaphelidium occidentale]